MATSTNRAKRKKLKDMLTPKQRVLLKHPDAFAHHFSDGWVIYKGDILSQTINNYGHRSASAAWRAAWEAVR